MSMSGSRVCPTCNSKMSPRGRYHGQANRASSLCIPSRGINAMPAKKKNAHAVRGNSVASHQERVREFFGRNSKRDLSIADDKRVKLAIGCRNAPEPLANFGMLIAYARTRADAAG